METNPTSHRGPLSCVRFISLPAIAATGLLLGGLGTAASRADILYVTNFGNNSIVLPGGGFGSSVFASTGLTNPFGLAFDGVGNLYATNTGANTIEKFTPGGVGSVFASTGLNNPHGLAFDSAGNLYAANGSGTIEKYSPTGTDLGVFASGLGGPQFLAFTNDAGVPLPLANQVPEPTTCAMLALGAVALLTRKRPRPVAR